MKLGKRDMQLLQLLRQNARLTLTQMSKKTKIPISTLYDKLKAHEKELILRHTTLIDFKKLGYDTKMQLLIKAPAQEKNRIQQYLLMNSNVNAIYKIMSEYDFLVEGIFEKNYEAYSFISDLEKAFATIELKPHFVVEDIKKESFFSDAVTQNRSTLS